MKPLIYLCLFLFSYTSLACNEYCFSDMFFESYLYSDLIIITKIDSLTLEKETTVKGKYTALLDKKSTLIVKGKLNKPLVGKYNYGYVCGTSYKPQLSKLRIIYARLINNEYVFHESNCSRKTLYLDDLEDYRLLKDSKNFKKYSDYDLNNRNKRLHFLLNNIKLTNKVYDSSYKVAPSKETSKKLNEIKVPKGLYSFYEIRFNSNGIIKKIKCLKRINKPIDKKIRSIIKDCVWKVRIDYQNTTTEKDLIRLLKFDNYSFASTVSYPDKPRKIRGRIIQQYK